jgi:hypothetical protein
MSLLDNGLTFLVCGLLGGWVIVSALAQHGRTRRFVSSIVRRDIYSLVPVWTFFAPNPGRTDLYLLYRDGGVDGDITPWREIALGSRKNCFSLWSPRRRIRKAIIDVTPDLTRDVSFKPREPVDKKKVLGFPYLLVLNYVCLQPGDFRASTRQFAIARTNGFGTEDEPFVLFLSAFHELPHTKTKRSLL